MDRTRLFFFSSCAAFAIGVGALSACGDDNALVRQRIDGGGGDGAAVDVDGGDGSACGITFPTDYVSAAYETNAKLELDLRIAFNAFIKPMADNEALDGGPDAALVTKVQLDSLWSGGAPSMKSITTPYYQTRIGTWLTSYEAAAKAGSIDAEMAAVTGGSDAPPPDGGFYGAYAYDGSLTDIRQAIETGSYAAAFFNHAMGIVAGGSLTEASIDRLVAAWGAHATFQNNHLATAGATEANKDVNSAGYAAQRTPKDGKPGPYLRAKTALIQAKAAIAAGSKCDAERDAALRIFFAEWEKATYASAIFYLNDVITKLSPPAADNTAAWTNIFHSHGVAIGLIAGFKSTPTTFRKITDAQIDDLLAKALLPEGGAAKIVQLKTAPTSSAFSLNDTLASIKSIYAFTDDEMSSFKQIFTK